MIVPRRVLGGPGHQAPSDTLNIGCVGVGGKGTSDIQAASTENIVALCDVDDAQMAGFMTNRGNKPEHQPKYDKAAKYRDFRKMLEKEKLDAVTVSTPDHTHAVIAMTAMKMGKHVLVQKPLTHTIKEARLLGEDAKKRNLVDADGQPGTRRRGRPARLRMDLGRGDRRRQRGPRLDEPADLAAGDRRPDRDPVRPADARLGPLARDRRPGGRTIRPTTPSAGAAGGTSAPAPSATWARTSSTSPSGPSSSTIL